MEALLRTGRSADAAGLAEVYQGRAAAKGRPWALARAARTEGLLAADRDLDATFRRALQLHATTLDTFEQARTELAYGARLRRARRRIDARPVLLRALRTFTGLGARTWAETAADEVEATGLTPARPGQAAVDQLTPRELQIATLLAAGRTTRQVAGALFLSPKTVEYHLRHVYTKFDIDSRSQLALRLQH